MFIKARQKDGHTEELSPQVVVDYEFPPSFANVGSWSTSYKALRWQAARGAAFQEPT